MVMVMPFRSVAACGLLPLALIAAVAAGAAKADGDSDLSTGDTDEGATIGAPDVMPDSGGEGDGSGGDFGTVDETPPDLTDPPVANVPGDTGDDEVMSTLSAEDCQDCDLAAASVGVGKAESMVQSRSTESGRSSRGGDDDCLVDGTTIRIAWCINW